ncbi:class I SAM-dependent methyltransferase [Rhizobium halophilum]|uniref:class I SAM-dependent methyltransferase n=1 Tax=Rhizobium halophilum TaxID=2846852 RepID=UPI001EFC3EF9|nr:class I SAM-dependent methyltransferase [Rhizobium halophilum]MCF6369696.1 class I SAM-dependent methyltransferase [Rhizobium halophilum]
MALILLSEQAPQDARVLVLGAGGGLELKTFASERPNWTFVGVDPSRQMLGLAAITLGPLLDRVHLVEGYIEDAPSGRFDSATCLLTFHFLNRAERLQVLRQLRDRLKPGAPLVVAHHACPAGADSEEWLARSVVFAAGSEADPAKAVASAKAMMERLSILSDEEEVELLRQAGFAKPALFYAGYTFRGWVAYA